jgi:hypothetical protein
MATGGYVSRVWGSSSEGETGTVWNRSSEWNHSILISSYRNNGHTSQSQWGNCCVHGMDTVLECGNASWLLIITPHTPSGPTWKNPVMLGLKNVVAIPQVRLDWSTMQTKTDVTTAAQYG